MVRDCVVLVSLFFDFIWWYFVVIMFYVEINFIGDLFFIFVVFYVKNFFFGFFVKGSVQEGRVQEDGGVVQVEINIYYDVLYFGFK